MRALTIKNLIVLSGFSAILSACAQAPHGQTRYGSETHVNAACCAVTPSCGVYVACAQQFVLRPAPYVVEYVAVENPIPEAPIVDIPPYVPPAPAPEPEYYTPAEPAPLPPVYTPPVFTPPVEAWPEPATPPPVWVPRK